MIASDIQQANDQDGDDDNDSESDEDAITVEVDQMVCKLNKTSNLCTTFFVSHRVYIPECNYSFFVCSLMWSLDHKSWRLDKSLVDQQL